MRGKATPLATRKSALFSELSDIRSISAVVQNFRAVCLSDVSSIPKLKEFLAGQNIPIVASAPLQSRPTKPSIVQYISSYDVVDASSYDRVLELVGQKVELVGKGVSVRSGIGRRKVKRAERRRSFASSHRNPCRRQTGNL